MCQVAGGWQKSNKSPDVIPAVGDEVWPQTVVDEMQRMPNTQACPPFTVNSPYQRCSMENPGANNYLDGPRFPPVPGYQHINQPWNIATHQVRGQTYGVNNNLVFSRNAHPPVVNTHVMPSSPLPIPPPPPLPPPPPCPPPVILKPTDITGDQDAIDPPELISTVGRGVEDAPRSTPLPPAEFNSVSLRNTVEKFLHEAHMEGSIEKIQMALYALNPPELEEKEGGVVIEKVAKSSRECSAQVAHSRVSKGYRPCDLQMQEVVTLGTSWEKPDGDCVFDVYSAQIQKLSPDSPSHVHSPQKGDSAAQEDTAQDGCVNLQWRQAIMEARTVDPCPVPQKDAELDWAATVDNVHIFPCQESDLVKCQRAGGILLLERRWFLKNPITEKTALFFCNMGELEDMVRSPRTFQSLIDCEIFFYTCFSLTIRLVFCCY